MFYSSQHNQYVQEGTAFTLGDAQYPANWLNLSTAEEKTAIGLVEVIATNSPGDDRFYWVSETLNGAQLTYTNTPKQLDDSVDEKGNKTTGLKTTWTDQVKNAVYTILQPTDYIEIRNIKDPTYKPEWITWRDSVRSESSNVVVQIAATKTVEELITVVDNIVWPEAPTGV